MENKKYLFDVRTEGEKYKLRFFSYEQEIQGEQEKLYGYEVCEPSHSYDDFTSEYDKKYEVEASSVGFLNLHHAITDAISSFVDL
jgi:hypothetical protein